MGTWIFQGDDAPSNPPAAVEYVPGPMPKWNPTKAPNGDDSGALWWDHDDPGGDGHDGLDGLPGATGRQGDNGGDTPQGYKLILPPDTDSTLTLVLAGG